VLVETVGIGQQEVDVTRLAATSIFVLTPDSGDAIQMMKAGILEVADIFVINKADQEGVLRVKADLQLMLNLDGASAGARRPPVLLTEAVNGKGVDDVVREIWKHRQILMSDGGLKKRARERARLELAEAVESSLKDLLDSGLDDAMRDRLVDDLTERKISPRAAASLILGQLLRPLQ